MNEIEKAIKTIKIAIAEVEWNYPLDYAIAFETAIEALQEKLEREKGCDYCKNISKQLKGHKGFGYAVLFEQITIDEIVEINIDVDYCPHCGRKLGENNG